MPCNRAIRLNDFETPGKHGLFFALNTLQLLALKCIYAKDIKQ